MEAEGELEALFGDEVVEAGRGGLAFCLLDED